MKNPLLDFLKVDEHLRRRRTLIEDFLKALKELLIKVEKLAWKTFSLNALECPFDRSCFSLSQSLVYIVDHLFSLVYIVDPLFFFLSSITLISSCIFWISILSPVFSPFETFYSIKKQEKTY